MMIYKLYLMISEFIRRPDMATPIGVVDRILKYHIWPMNPIREELGAPLVVSEKSGYRPPQHEISKGRSGTGEHSYPGESKGATDWTTLKSHLAKLGRLLDEKSPYVRICYYPDNGFYHCDYKFEKQGRRYFIQRKTDKSWTEVTRDKWLEEVGHG